MLQLVKRLVSAAGGNKVYLDTLIDAISWLTSCLVAAEVTWIVRIENETLKVFCFINSGEGTWYKK